MNGQQRIFYHLVSINLSLCYANNSSVNTIQEKGSTGSKYGNEFRGKYWMKEVSHFPSVQFHSFLGDGSEVILTRGISRKNRKRDTCANGIIFLGVKIRTLFEYQLELFWAQNMLLQTVYKNGLKAFFPNKDWKVFSSQLKCGYQNVCIYLFPELSFIQAKNAINIINGRKNSFECMRTF